MAKLTGINDSLHTLSSCERSVDTSSPTGKGRGVVVMEGGVFVHEPSLDTIGVLRTNR